MLFVKISEVTKIINGKLIGKFYVSKRIRRSSNLIAVKKSSRNPLSYTKENIENNKKNIQKNFKFLKILIYYVKCSAIT